MKISSGTASFPAFKEQAESKRLSFFSAIEGSTVPVQYVTCTAIQSSEKLWDVDAATSITRTRKDVFEDSTKSSYVPKCSLRHQEHTCWSPCRVWS
jgi:hypothetical protein